MDFGWAQVPGESSWRTGGKSNGKNLPRNPLHNLLENLLNTWPVLTVFIDLILGTKKIKERRTPTCLGNSYWGPADRRDFGTHCVVAPARAQLHPVPLACSWGGLRKQEMKDCKGINILLGYVLPAIGERTFWNLRLSYVSFLLSLFFAVPVSSMLGFLSLPLCWVFFVFSFHRVSFHWVGLLLAGAQPRLFQPG